jgi:Abnormal spindle-like microcephaly-assoc'd, ASPM-SPD-2-Hydin
VRLCKSSRSDFPRGNTTKRGMLALFSFFLVGIAAQGQPVVTLSTTSLAFGSQTIGTTSSAQIVTLTNTGTSVLSIASIVLQGAVNDFTQTNNCGSTVGAGASCTFTVNFSPDLAVTRTATIVITDNALPKQQKINLSGTGVVSVVRLSPSNVVFNKQAVGTTSGARSVTLTNTGATALTISSIVASANFGETNNCGGSVAAGAACSISVTFTPAAIWTQTGAITINDSAQDTPQVLPMAGMGTGKAVASLSVQSMSFGSQVIGSSSSPQAVTLTNTGTDVLTINSVIASGDYSQTTTCGSTLSAGANCSITLTFTPSAAGTRSGDLTLNDTASPFLQTVNLTGTGTAPTTTVAISPRVASVTLTQAQQFSATISGVGSTDVIWAVDGVAGGSASSGMIDSTGLYTPPSAAGLHQITATSIADPSQIATVPVTVTTFAGVLTYKNDNQRTGQNLTETVLTTGNVNANQFGKLFSYPVDGYVFAQPLYVPSMSIPNQGVHNVVYVATEHDSVFAFDADNLTPVPLWQTSLIDPAEGITTVPAADVEGVGSDIPTEIGITPTPVIDLSRNAIYVLARTKEVSGSQTSYVQRLHALDLTTGAELAGSPVVISAQVSGIGAGSSRGIVAFDGKRENSRPGLLLLNGVVYAGWASLGDIIPFHGWVLGYDGGSLEQVTVFNTTPNGSDGGIWQSGGGLAADDNGNIFAIVGNGDFDVAAAGIDYGDSVLRLTNNGSSLSVGDYFTPYNQATFDNSDLDLGSGGPLLLPDQPGTFPHLMVVGGKDATLYLINRDNLGQFNHTGNSVPMYVPAAVGKPGPGSSGNRGTPAYWQGQVYFTGSTDVLKAFGLYNGLLSASPLAMGSLKCNYPGGEAAISANGNTNGILWVLQADQFKISGPVVLRAYDAANVSRELFDSTTLSANTAGPAVKFSVPTIANAKVYVGTQTELDVFGLLP